LNETFRHQPHNHNETSVTIKKVSKVMIQESDENIIRKHLLGSLTEEERSHAEEKLFTDDDYFELLTVIEDELIDDYISGDLTEEDRKQFEAHFLSTPERREKLGFARTLNEYVSREDVPNPNPISQPDPIPIPRPVWWKPLFSSPYFGLAAAAAVIVIGILIWPFIFPPGPSKGMVALKEAYRDQRPVESRITEFDYAPPPPVTRGGEQEKFDYVARDRAQALIQLEAAEHPSAQSYHDLGQLYLTQHEFDKAIEQFEKALALSDKNAQLHNDYGVALMEKGKAERLKNEGGNSLEDFARALEHFNKAIDLDGALLEALFNRALCRQEMSLFQQAEEDWQAYLQKDPNSKWADEARQRLKAIEIQKGKFSQTKEELLEDFLRAYKAKDDETTWPLITQNRDMLSGRWITEQLLNRYLNLSITESYPAEDTLRALAYVGELELSKTQDRYTADLASLYARSSIEQKKKLTSAHGQMGLGRQRLFAEQYDQAIEAYAKAQHLFGEVGDDCESHMAEYWLTFCLRSQSDVSKSFEVFEKLAAYFEKSNYRWMLQNALIMISNAQFDLTNYSAAIGYANQALELSKQIDSPGGELSALTLLIEYNRHIGNYSQSLYCAQLGLPLLHSCALNPIKVMTLYGITANVLATDKLYFAAMGFQKETLSLALAINDITTSSVSYAQMGSIYGKIGNYDEALKNFKLAYEIARQHSDPKAGKQMQAYTALQTAYLYRLTGDYNKSIASYDDAINIFQELELENFLYQAHKGRFVCHMEQGNDLQAKQELDTVLSLAEKYRSRILEGDNRNSFFDVEQSIYDLGITFASSRMHSPEKAFEYSELSRARSLLDQMLSGANILSNDKAPDMKFKTVSSPLALADIQRRLPRRTRVIQYAVLENKLLIWLISKDDFQVVEKNLSQEDLNNLVTSYLSMLSSDSKADAEMIQKESSQLFEILIKPIATRLNHDETLCIVADKILNYLPFAALFSGQSGKYLIEDYCLVYSPSSSVFIICSEEATRKESKKPETLLSVGDPIFDRRHEELKELPNLSSARREVNTIALYYNAQRPLIGERASKRQIESAIADADVVHFAVHAIVDEHSPLLSKLVLAKDSNGSNVQKESTEFLKAYEIYRLNLRRTRLVVLSACQTAIARYYKGEGMINIARSFIAAGVPLTVASLWKVDSDSTADLMISFHKHRKLNSTAQAMRLAQKEMLQSQEARYHLPNYWASFIVIGGSADF